jgi:hypothetical protein
MNRLTALKRTVNSMRGRFLRTVAFEFSCGEFVGDILTTIGR